MSDFWLSCGHHLLDRDEGGRLLVTADFLKAYLARPELAPPADACVVERTIHAALLKDPYRPVRGDEVAAIADPDARENWAMMLDLRNRLVAHKTVECAYMHLVRDGVGDTPLLFLNQLVHVILRNILDGCDDAFVLRAAELFFRTQRLTTHEGSLIAADDETLAGAQAPGSSPLVSMLGLPASAEIDVLGEHNAPTYWERGDRFDLGLDLTAGRRGLAALGEVIVRWLAHLLAIEVEVEPLVEARDVAFNWYVGLDAQATRIGNSLWQGEELDEATRSRIVAIYRLMVRDRSDVLDAARGEPIYLLMAMTPDGLLRMKPQNLVTGLPLRCLEPVS
jgi:hypothetical protein